jgi:hypothetical protein
MYYIAYLPNKSTFETCSYEFNPDCIVRMHRGVARGAPIIVSEAIRKANIEIQQIKMIPTTTFSLESDNRVRLTLTIDRNNNNNRNCRNTDFILTKKQNIDVFILEDPNNCIKRIESVKNTNNISLKSSRAYENGTLFVIFKQDYTNKKCRVSSRRRLSFFMCGSVKDRNGAQIVNGNIKPDIKNWNR